MRLLLDENLPKRLRDDLAAYDVFTVRYMGWAGKKNGELMALMLQGGFEVLLTFDKNLEYQQNFEKYPITVFVLTADGNDYFSLKPLRALVIQLLEKGDLLAGPIVIK